MQKTAIPTKHKKGARVQYTEKGVTKYGVVIKGGSKRITVILDGGVNEVRGHPSLFEASTQPLPVDAIKTAMDYYKITGYKEFRAMIHKGYPFVGKVVTPTGAKIGFEYDGNGGPVNFDWRSEKVWDQFKADIEAWHEAMGSRYKGSK